MENSKAASGEGKATATAAAAATVVAGEEKSNNINAPTVAVVVQGGGGPDVAVVNEVDNQSRPSSTTRTPFTNLSQVDADLALARTLQEQERAYMMLMMNVDGSDYGSWESENYMHGDDDDSDDQSEDEYGTDADDNDDGNDNDDDDDDDNDDEDDEEDAVDVHQDADEGDDSSPGVELDPSSFPNDEAYARALQDAEDREMAARLLALAGLNDMLTVEAEESDDHGGNSQDSWDEVDPDELSYEELLALGEVVGTESRGLSADKIASLPSVNYKTQSGQEGNSDPCVICRLDYEDDDALTVLSCKHSYHSECINNWLRINKVCPVCSAEVSTSGNS